MVSKNHLPKIERNQAILNYRRYHPESSYAEIARVFTLTRERVRQIFVRFGNG